MFEGKRLEIPHKMSFSAVQQISKNEIWEQISESGFETAHV